jgi:hypothetical protein
MRVPHFRFEFLVAKKPLPDRVHPFQFLKSILDRCDCPYKLINVVHDDMSAQIARLSSERHHTRWLDFDSILTEELLDAVHLAAAQLSVESILLVRSTSSHLAGLKMG